MQTLIWCQRFGVTCCSPLKRISWRQQISVSTYQTSWRHILEDRNLNAATAIPRESQLFEVPSFCLFVTI
jgi:hypothetical protein